MSLMALGMNAAGSGPGHCWAAYTVRRTLEGSIQDCMGRLSRNAATLQAHASIYSILSSDPSARFRNRDNLLPLNKGLSYTRWYFLHWADNGKYGGLGVIMQPTEVCTQGFFTENIMTMTKVTANMIATIMVITAPILVPLAPPQGHHET
jgi:hypothetical protein